MRFPASHAGMCMQFSTIEQFEAYMATAKRASVVRGWRAAALAQYGAPTQIYRR